MADAQAPSQEFMEAAIEEARKGLAEGGIPIGSVIVHKGRIIGRGHNRRVQQGSVVLHGEMDAFENAGRQPASVYAESTLYTTLSPCSMCSGAILLYGIPEVVIGENRTFLGEEALLEQRGVKVSVVQNQACIELMQQFITAQPTLWNEDIGQESDCGVTVRKHPSMHIIHLQPRPVEQGGMSEAVRQFDWSQTSLGPLHRWPSALRIAVDLMLASRFPGCLVWGSEMVTLYNDAFVPILGTKPSPLGRGFDQIWSDVWSEIGPLVYRVMGGEAVFIENFPLVTSRNGAMEQVYFTFSYSPIRDEHGRVVGFLDTVLETTSSVESERQWRDLACSFEQQIRERTADHERLWELSSDLMFKVHDDLRLSTFNPACQQVLGWDDDNLDQALFDMVYPDDRDGIAQLLGGTQATGEGRLRHRDGHYRWFALSVMPGPDAAILMGRDITQDRERELALRQAEELLRHGQKMEAVGQLTGGMAHDFNNLLAGISASLEMLERRIARGQTNDLDKYLHAARQASCRAAELTHRLLAFARRQPLSPKPTDLNGLLAGIEPLILQVMGPDVELQIQADPQPWRVLVDNSQMENALINLCANARDAMGRRGRLKISTSNERHHADIPGSDVPPGDYCSLCLEDTGCGMSAQTLARAFDPFFTTKPAGQGTGLGLSMVYGFVRQSGGRIWITSEEGKGTRVELLLPRFAGPAVPSPQPSEAPSPAALAVRNERVLLIDDEPTLRMLIKEALEEQGLEVLDAADASSGLALFETGGPIDLVVSDIGLPGGVSGIQVARQLRQRAPRLPVLFITGFTEEALDPGEVLGPGLELMTKPFGLEALVHKVSAMLQPERLAADADARPRGLATRSSTR